MGLCPVRPVTHSGLTAQGGLLAAPGIAWHFEPRWHPPEPPVNCLPVSLRELGSLEGGGLGLEDWPFHLQSCVTLVICTKLLQARVLHLRGSGSCAHHPVCEGYGVKHGGAQPGVRQ